MKLLLGSAAALALITVPATANAQLFGNLDNNTVLGGTAGAGLGAVLGSQIAPSGNRTEGAAIGALAGGLLGASYGNSRSNYYGNPYAGQFNPGFNGNNLLGAGVGAGLGGVIGSNLAGSGNRQEGTAIGAALGGLAGYAVANRRQNARFGTPAYGSGYGGGYGAPAYGGGYGAPAYGPGYAPGFGPGLNGYGAPGFVPAPPVLSGPQYINSGQFISGPVVPVTTYSQPAPTYTTVYRPAPVVRPTVVQRTIRIEQMPTVRAERVVTESAPCPAGTTTQADGSCLQAERIAAAPSYSYSASSGISTYEPAPVTAPLFTPAPAPVEMALCPAGTTPSGDGTCMQASTSYAAPAYVTPSYTPAPSTYAPAPVVTQSYSAPEMAPCPAGTTQQSDGSCMQSGSSYSAPMLAGPSYTVPDTVVMPKAQYCYPDSDKRYDSMGREIIKGGKHGMHHNGQKMVPCQH